ncbi:E3 SUMO-protein ligase KIAA1586-like [Tachypleus tridentatus]|uniref:E3 SUMO-protein ligase KIAA1586-like n=1 Tax=Tachypleus tridentatus TaxID=6853 RepID=UPI003FD5B11B
MDCAHLKSRHNAQENDNKIHELVNILETDSWDIDEVVVPWKAAKEKLCKFSKFFHQEIDVNDFHDYVENALRNRHNYEIPRTVQKAKNIISTVALSSEEAERGFLRMNIKYSDKRSCLTVENVANLTTINLIGLPLDSWDPTSSV